MSEQTQETDRVRGSQVAAGALAAVTAAVVGSTMGVAGTVVGAGLASVISTVGGSLYLRSIQRTRDSVRTVRAKVVGRSGGATVLVSDEDPEQPATPGEEVEAAPEEAVVRPPEDRAVSRRRRWAALAATTVAAFVLGMVAITGVEWVRGESLSGGSGTTFSDIVAPHRDSGGTEAPSGSTTSTTTPTTTSTSPDAGATTNPTTTSTTPPSRSDTTTTTTTPPVTTTTGASQTQGSAPASG